MSIAPLLALKDGWISSSQIMQIPVIMSIYYDIPSPIRTDGIYRKDMEISSLEENSFLEEKGLYELKYNKLSKHKPLLI